MLGNVLAETTRSGRRLLLPTSRDNNINSIQRSDCIFRPAGSGTAYSHWPIYRSKSIRRARILWPDVLTPKTGKSAPNSGMGLGATHMDGSESRTGQSASRYPNQNYISRYRRMRDLIGPGLTWVNHIAYLIVWRPEIRSLQILYHHKYNLGREIPLNIIQQVLVDSVRQTNLRKPTLLLYAL